jgi:hypothetical protein
MTKYNPSKLHQELLAAGIPVISVDENGICEFDSATPAQLKAAHLIIDAHDPIPTQDTFEVASISQETLTKMVLTLWDMVVENKLDAEIKHKVSAIDQLTKSIFKASVLHTSLVDQHQADLPIKGELTDGIISKTLR